MDVRMKDLAIIEGFLSVASVEGFLPLFCTLNLSKSTRAKSVPTKAEKMGSRCPHFHQREGFFLYQICSTMAAVQL